MKIGAAILLIAVSRVFLVESWGFFGEEPQFDASQGKKSPYEILGVDRSATAKDVRKAFLALSKKFHPDVSKEEGAAERYKEINEAYDILSNADKRRAYDEDGFAGVLRMNRGDGADQDYDIHDVFSSFFGFGGGRSGQDSMKAQPLVFPLDLPLEALYLGRDVEVKLRLQRLCKNYDECEVKRPDCADAGVKMVTIQHGPGMYFQQQLRDTSCIARHRGFKPNCKACPNGPTYQEDVVLDLTVEPGFQNGQKIVLHGRGQDMPGLKRGDLVFVINQQHHPIYRREGDDLYRNLDITLKEALLGFKQDIDLFGNSIEVAQAGVTPHDFIIKIEKSGMPRLERGGFGDLYVVIKVTFPKRITDTQAQLLEKAL